MRVHYITDKGRDPQIGDLIVDSHGNVGQYSGFAFNTHVDPELAEEARKAVRWSRDGVALKGQSAGAQHQIALDYTPLGRTARDFAIIVEGREGVTK